MDEEIKKSCEMLKKGGIILYPTDTIWGIGCDATNEEAVKRIYKIKQRSDSKSLLVLLDALENLDYYVADVPEIVSDLVTLSDKPLSIILSGAMNLAPNLIVEDGSIGIRITKEPFSQKLCRRFGKPIVSTSANISGEPSPANFSKISDAILRSVDYVVNYRREETQESQPSGIIQIGKGGLIKIIRE